MSKSPPTMEKWEPPTITAYKDHSFPAYRSDFPYRTLQKDFLAVLTTLNRCINGIYIPSGVFSVITFLIPFFTPPRVSLDVDLLTALNLGSLMSLIISGFGRYYARKRIEALCTLQNKLCFNGVQEVNESDKLAAADYQPSSAALMIQQLVLLAVFWGEKSYLERDHQDQAIMVVLALWLVQLISSHANYNRIRDETRTKVAAFFPYIKEDSTMVRAQDDWNLDVTPSDESRQGTGNNHHVTKRKND